MIHIVDSANRSRRAGFFVIRSVGNQVVETLKPDQTGKFIAVVANFDFTMRDNTLFVRRADRYRSIRWMRVTWPELFRTKSNGMSPAALMNAVCSGSSPVGSDWGTAGVTAWCSAVRPDSGEPGRYFGTDGIAFHVTIPTRVTPARSAERWRFCRRRAILFRASEAARMGKSAASPARLSSSGSEDVW